MEIREISAAIRESVSAVEVGKALGLNVDRHGRCSCPFHQGKDRNMKLFDGNRGYYCFVCHKGGDCISLVQGVAPECSYLDAMWWVNDYFQLGFRDRFDKPNFRQRNMKHAVSDTGRSNRANAHIATGGASETGTGRTTGEKTGSR